MFGFTGQDKDQVCLGDPLVMSEPNLKQSFSIQACDLDIPNHGHGHDDVRIPIS